MNNQELQIVLGCYGVPVEKWGQGSAKTVKHLQDEVDAGETVLVEQEGKLLRQVGVSVVDVIHNQRNRRLKLVEEKQVFNDGRQRTRDIGGSIAEKLLPNEGAENAALRAVREELQVTGSLNIRSKRTDEEIKDSPSYPGLQTKYVRHYFETELDGNQFRPEGYTETQPDKTTFFVWKEA